LRHLLVRLVRPVELYQPLYGVELPGRSAGRACAPRWEAIRRSLASYGFRFPGSTALDVGASLGYFTISLAREGARVDAIDTSRRLGAIVRLLALYNGVGPRVRFRRRLLTNEWLSGESSRSVLRERYDVVLLLSVIQHVCHSRGFDYARELITMLSNRADFLVIEPGLASETHHRWAASQPADPSSFLEGQFRAGFEQIGIGSDLERGEAAIQRPLYLGRNI
jgi:hypothetical protein